MRRLVCGLAVLIALPTSPAVALPQFRATIRPIGPSLARWMTPTSWRPGCPVALADLRLVTVSHRDLRGGLRRGSLVVHEDVATDVVRLFRGFWRAKFRIHRIRLIDAYGGSDFRSIEADNTSAFNCRYVDGTTRWSNHAFGRAIDINPIENPYVSGDGTTSHRASEAFLDRRRARPGMLREGGRAVAVIDSLGWDWGGRWSGVHDYQHVSATGG